MERLASLRHLLAPSLARACEGASSSGRPPLECAISSLTRLSLGSTNHQGPSSPWHLGYRSAHSQAAGSAKAPASSGNQASTSAPEAGQGAASPATTSQPTAPSTLHASKALQHVNQKARPAKYTPWTSTRMLDRHRPIGKRMGFLIESLEEEQVGGMLCRPVALYDRHTEGHACISCACRMCIHTIWQHGMAHECVQLCGHSHCPEQDVGPLHAPCYLACPMHAG